MTRAQGFEDWPWDYRWFFLQSSEQEGPGRVRIMDDPSGGDNYWDIHVRSFDALAQKHMTDRGTREGLPIAMPDSRVLHVPYRQIDEEADLTIQRGMQAPLGDEQVKVVTVEGVELNLPRDYYWGQLIPAFIERRGQQLPISLDIGNGKPPLVVEFNFWDCVCKDFMRRRGDLISAGWWPELMMREGTDLEGPKPVHGRANSLGQGVSVPGGEPGVPGVQPGHLQAQPPPQPSAGPVGHPGTDNEGII